jgi:DNA polymerase alpha subunit B
MQTLTADDIKNAIIDPNVKDNLEPVILQKCALMATKLKIKAKDFNNYLEAFLLETSNENLSIDILGKFDLYLIKETTIASQKIKAEIKVEGMNKPPLPPSSSSSSHSAPSPGNSQNIKRQGQFGTPNSQKSSKIAFTSTPDGVTPTSTQASTPSYNERQNSGAVVSSHNPNLEMRGAFQRATQAANILGMRCEISTRVEECENITQRYRYMFTTLDERARSLDKQLLSLQEQMCEEAHINPDDIQPIGVPSQTDVWVSGRICCEEATGKMGSKTVVLEGGRRDGGRRVRLDLTETPNYTLFPGQKLLVYGMCSSGRVMIVKRIIDGIPRPKPFTTPKKLLEYHHTKKYQSGSALNIVTAAGPFSTSDNLNYKPIEDFFIKMLEQKPDVIILIGPFVDISHEKCTEGEVFIETENDGDVSVSFEQLFKNKIIDLLKLFFETEEKIPTNFILVPSLLDAHHEFVFPQPPFGDRDPIETPFFEDNEGVYNIPFSRHDDLEKRVHLLPNPCTFR